MVSDKGKVWGHLVPEVLTGLDGSSRRTGQNGKMEQEETECPEKKLQI